MMTRSCDDAAEALERETAASFRQQLRDRRGSPDPAILAEREDYTRALMQETIDLIGRMQPHLKRAPHRNRAEIAAAAVVLGEELRRKPKLSDNAERVYDAIWTAGEALRRLTLYTGKMPVRIQQQFRDQRALVECEISKLRQQPKPSDQ